VPTPSFDNTDALMLSGESARSLPYRVGEMRNRIVGRRVGHAPVLPAHRHGDR